MPRPVVLLGPQRFRPFVREVVSDLAAAGHVAVITAGWQEREGENDELRAHLGCEVIDLQLYRRADDVMLRDRELAVALNERQEILQEQQQLYRLRLDHALGAARELCQRPGDGASIEAERRDAIRAVRNLDRHHLRRLREIHVTFEERFMPRRRPVVARHREQLARTMSRCGILAVAGGHVAVLLNRMRLFGFDRPIERLPLVAWSAGAMAVTEQVVLFHDSPPQGAGNAEVLDAGLGLCRGVVALPHARRRLRLDDAQRVSLFARRFAPAACIALDEGVRLVWDGERWQAAPGALRLVAEGRLREVGAVS